MKAPLLSLRVTRRAIAGIVLDDERADFFDGRHLSSKRERAVKAAARYVSRLLDVTTPSAIIIDAPAAAGSTTDAVIICLRELFQQRTIPAIPVVMSDVFGAFGEPALHSRTAVRAMAEPFWTLSSRLSAGVRSLVIDAAVAALYVETHRALEPTPP